MLTSFRIWLIAVFLILYVDFSTEALNSYISKQSIETAPEVEMIRKLTKLAVISTNKAEEHATEATSIALHSVRKNELFGTGNSEKGVSGGNNSVGVIPRTATGPISVRDLPNGKPGTVLSQTNATGSVITVDGSNRKNGTILSNNTANVRKIRQVFDRNASTGNTGSSKLTNVAATGAVFVGGTSARNTGSAISKVATGRKFTTGNTSNTLSNAAAATGPIFSGDASTGSAAGGSTKTANHNTKRYVKKNTSSSNKENVVGNTDDVKTGKRSISETPAGATNKPNNIAATAVTSYRDELCVCHSKQHRIKCTIISKKKHKKRFKINTDKNHITYYLEPGTNIEKISIIVGLSMSIEGSSPLSPCCLTGKGRIVCFDMDKKRFELPPPKNGKGYLDIETSFDNVCGLTSNGVIECAKYDNSITHFRPYPFQLKAKDFNYVQSKCFGPIKDGRIFCNHMLDGEISPCFKEISVGGNFFDGEFHPYHSGYWLPWATTEYNAQDKFLISLASSGKISIIKNTKKQLSVVEHHNPLNTAFSVAIMPNQQNEVGRSKSKFKNILESISFLKGKTAGRRRRLLFGSFKSPSNQAYSGDVVANKIRNKRKKIMDPEKFVRELAAQEAEQAIHREKNVFCQERDVKMEDIGGDFQRNTESVQFKILREQIFQKFQNVLDLYDEKGNSTRFHSEWCKRDKNRAKFWEFAQHEVIKIHKFASELPNNNNNFEREKIDKTMEWLFLRTSGRFCRDTRCHPGGPAMKVGIDKVYWKVEGKSCADFAERFDSLEDLNAIDTVLKKIYCMEIKSIDYEASQKEIEERKKISAEEEEKQRNKVFQEQVTACVKSSNLDGGGNLPETIEAKIAYIRKIYKTQLDIKYHSWYLDGLKPEVFMELPEVSCYRRPAKIIGITDKSISGIELVDVSQHNVEATFIEEGAFISPINKVFEVIQDEDNEYRILDAEDFSYNLLMRKPRIECSMDCEGNAKTYCKALRDGESPTVSFNVKIYDDINNCCMGNLYKDCKCNNGKKSLLLNSEWIVEASGSRYKYTEKPGNRQNLLKKNRRRRLLSQMMQRGGGGAS